MNEETEPRKSERLFRAIEFASKAHSGQFRKGSGVPYIVHPLGVARILIELGCSEEVVIAGVLHDVVEDTKFTLEDVRGEFGSEVARLVDGCTEPHHGSESWEVRKKHTVELLKTAELGALLVACADKLDNLRSTLLDIDSIGDKVWGKFLRGRESQEWYFRSLAEVFMSRIDDGPSSVLFPQLNSVVEKVFSAS